MVLTRLLQEEQPPEEEAEVRVLHAQRPLQGQERGGGLRGGGGQELALLQIQVGLQLVGMESLVMFEVLQLYVLFCFVPSRLW